MQTSITDFINICEWDPARFFIISENVFGQLIYYSHLLPLVVSILLAMFVFLKNTKLLASRWLLVTTLLLSFWLFFDLILWATEKPSFTMFFWSIINLIEPLIYVGMLFFAYALIDKKDIPFKSKIVIFILLLPIIVLASTHFALTEYDLSNCDREAIEGPLAFYGYTVEVILSLWILIFGFNRFFAQKIVAEKKKIAIAIAGIVFFLLSFAMGNVVGSLLVDWTIGQYGLFGIPVFAALLSYLIVRFHTFNIKLIATQALITILFLLVVSVLFIRTIESARIIIAITSGLLLILGILLTRSVKREIEQRIEIESLAGELAMSNDGQKNLIHIINHQIKGFLGVAKNIFAELLTGDYGVMPEPSKPLLTHGFEQMGAGVDYVQGILRGASAESGVLPYSMKSVDLVPVVTSLMAEQKEVAEKRELSFESNIENGDYKITGDGVQLKEAFKNLITNAIKYNSPKGSVKVTFKKEYGRILFSVKDTGIGIADDDKAKLFTAGGVGKNSIKHNTDAAGYGLSFVKGVATAHKGTVGYKANVGEKGTTFFVELPIK